MRHIAARIAIPVISVAPAKATGFASQILIEVTMTRVTRRLRTFILLTSAVRILPAVTIEQYHPHDFALSAEASGNPFDIELIGKFVGPDGTRITVPGYYAGNNTWK